MDKIKISQGDGSDSESGESEWADRFVEQIEREGAKARRREEEKRGWFDRSPVLLPFFIDILKFLVLLARLCADNSKRRNFTGMDRMNRIRLGFKDLSCSSCPSL
jgi:hypothetical protein